MMYVRSKNKRKAKQKTLLEQSIRFVVTKDRGGRGEGGGREALTQTSGYVKSWDAMSSMAYSNHCWRLSRKAVKGADPIRRGKKSHPSFIFASV